MEFTEAGTSLQSNPSVGEKEEQHLHEIQIKTIF
jgi:hypothetical protein